MTEFAMSILRIVISCIVVNAMSKTESVGSKLCYEKANILVSNYASLLLNKPSVEDCKTVCEHMDECRAVQFYGNVNEGEKNCVLLNEPFSEEDFFRNVVYDANANVTYSDKMQCGTESIVDACMALTQKRAIYRGSCFVLEERHLGLTAGRAQCTHLKGFMGASNEKPMLAVVNTPQLKKFFRQLMVAWYGGYYTWVRVNGGRSHPTSIRYPAAGHDLGWYWESNGRNWAVPAKTSGVDLWAPGGPDWLTSDCLSYQYNPNNGRIGLDALPCGHPVPNICEYRSKQRVYRTTVRGQRAKRSMLLSSNIYNDKFDCVKACRDNWVCASFAYNSITKDCRLQTIDSSNINMFEEAAGYEVQEVDDDLKAIFV